MCTFLCTVFISILGFLPHLQESQQRQEPVVQRGRTVPHLCRGPRSNRSTVGTHLASIVMSLVSGNSPSLYSDVIRQ